MRSSTIWLALMMLSATAVPAPVWAMGAEDPSSGSEDAPELAAVRTKIQAKDYSGALADLRAMKPSADVYNLMGYSFRKSGDPAQGLVYYEKALAIDPAHKETLEYLGELYVEAGQLDKAREEAALLHRLCPAGCEELSDLEHAIAGASPGSSNSQASGRGTWR